MAEAPPLVATPDALTPAWLTGALHAAGVALGARVVDVARQRVGTGQVAMNVRCRLQWDCAVADAPASVVVKLPSDDPISRATGAAQQCYRKEVEFYRQVAATVAIRTPRCWLADIDDAGQEFFLVMEDVAPAVQGDQLTGCTIEQATLALAELAKLHAPRWGDASLGDLPFLADSISERAANFQALYAAVWPAFRERYAVRLSSELLAVTERFAPRVGAWVLGTEGSLTVVHGDFRLDNMLFGTGPGAPPLAVVDWQTVARGLGTADAAYFLGAGLLVDDRRVHERALLRTYWEALGAGGVTDYAFETCWRDYRRTAFSGIVIAVIASMIVVQTPRGDDMFMAMTARHAQQILDLESEALL
ncbi:MAG: phosphotransferase [Candidatus Binatia bacterium]